MFSPKTIEKIQQSTNITWNPMSFSCIVGICKPGITRKDLQPLKYNAYSYDEQTQKHVLEFKNVAKCRIDELKKEVMEVIKNAKK